MSPHPPGRGEEGPKPLRRGGGGDGDDGEGDSGCGGDAVCGGDSEDGDMVMTVVRR